MKPGVSGNGALDARCFTPFRDAAAPMPPECRLRRGGAVEVVARVPQPLDRPPCTWHTGVRFSPGLLCLLKGEVMNPCPDALEWLASVLDADGRDPLPCDRMMLTLVLSELSDLRSALTVATQGSESAAALRAAQERLEECRRALVARSQELVVLKRRLEEKSRALAEYLAEGE